MIHFSIAFVIIIMKKDFYFYYLKTYGCLDTHEEYSKLKYDCKCSYLNPQDSNRFVSFFLSHNLLFFFKSKQNFFRFDGY